MKRYLVFLGATYYPSGGMNDFLTDAETIEAAIHAVKQETNVYWEWVHIYDTETKKIVFTEEDF